MIQEIFAEADYGVRVYEKTEESYDSYIISCYLKIYGIPDDLTDNEEENFFNGEIGKAVQIGTVTGLLILGGQAEKTIWTFTMSVTVRTVMPNLFIRR